MASAHRAPWVAKKAAEAASATASSLTMATSLQQQTNSSSNEHDIQTHSFLPLLPLKMMKPWNERRNRVYDDPSHFVEVMYAWYREAWTPYPEEDLERFDTVDRRFQVASIKCRYAATHGV